MYISKLFFYPPKVASKKIAICNLAIFVWHKFRSIVFVFVNIKGRELIGEVGVAFLKKPVGEYLIHYPALKAYGNIIVLCITAKLPHIAYCNICITNSLFVKFELARRGMNKEFIIIQACFIQSKLATKNIIITYCFF